MPSASRTGELLVWECNRATKKCSPAPGLSGQWCKDSLWKSLQGTEFQRWTLTCRNREKAPRIGMSNQKEKMKMPIVGNWDTGISNEIQSEVYGWEIPKRGGEALPTCLCKSWKKCHILFVVFFGWLKNSLKSSNISQEKILGFFPGGVRRGRGPFSCNIFSIQIRRLSASWGETQKPFLRKPGSISKINGMEDGKCFKNVRLAGNTGTFLVDIYFLGMQGLF